LQIQESSILEKEFTMMTYKDCTTQYLKIEEDIENPKVLSAKKKPENA
jgi:hypothetical protein